MLFFAPALFGDRIFYFRDLSFFHYPLKFHWVFQLQSGSLPFLNPSLNGGQPLLANPNYAIFYPANFLYFLVPFDLAWNSILAGHVLWGGLGLYWLARRLGCERLAAFVGALGFAFGGPLLSSLTYYNLLLAASWLPWVAGLAILAWKSGGKYLPLSCVALGLQLLAGEPSMEIVTAGLLTAGWLTGIGVAAWRERQDPRRLRLGVTRLARGAAIAVGALMIAAVQLIPTLLWLPHTTRGGGLDFTLSAARWSLHPARLAEFLVPHWYGNVMGSAAEEFWGESLSDSGYPYILKIYLGWLPLVLAPLAWGRAAGRAALACFLAGVVLAMGRWTPGYAMLFDLVAPLRLVRYPEKFLLLASFGLSTAAALGTSQLLRRRSYRPAICTALALLLTVAVIAVSASVLPAPQESLRIRALWQAAACGAVALLLTGLAATVRWRGIAILLLPVAAFADLAAVTWEVPRTHPRQLVHQLPVLLARAPELRNAVILHRGEEQSDIYFAGTVEPLRYIHDALHPLVGLSWGTAYGATNDIDRMGWKTSVYRQDWLRQNFPSSAALSLMREAGISWVVSLRALGHEALPLVAASRGAGGEQIYLYGLSPSALPAVRWEDAEGDLVWREPTPYRIDIDVEAQRDGRLVLTRNALPGWAVYCDGASAILEVTRAGWLAIPVPAGKHRLLLKYTVPGFASGAAVTAMALLAAVASMLITKLWGQDSHAAASS